MATGVLTSANVPKCDGPFPEPVPFPVVSTGALTLTRGEPEAPAAPLPEPAEGVVPVTGLPPSVVFGAAVGSVPWHAVPAEAGVLAESKPAPPTPSSAMAQAMDVIAETRRVEVVI